MADKRYEQELRARGAAGDGDSEGTASAAWASTTGMGLRRKECFLHTFPSVLGVVRDQRGNQSAAVLKFDCDPFDRAVDEDILCRAC